jgi:hypothetical protein
MQKLKGSPDRQERRLRPMGSRRSIVRPLLWQNHNKEWVYFKLQRISEATASGLASLPEMVANHGQAGGDPILNATIITDNHP